MIKTVPEAKEKVKQVELASLNDLIPGLEQVPNQTTGEPVITGGDGNSFVGFDLPNSQIGKNAMGKESKESSPKLSILYILHDGKGGVFHTSLDLARSMAFSYNVYLLVTGLKEWTLSQITADGISTMIETFQFSEAWTSFELLDNAREQILDRLLDSYRFKIVHIRHFIGNAPEVIAVVKQKGIFVVVSFHDFYTICPTITLLDDKLTYCGGNCTAGDGQCNLVKKWFPDGIANLKHHRVLEHQRRMEESLIQADFFVVTSETSKEVILSKFSRLDCSKVHVIEHGRNIKKESLAVTIRGAAKIPLVSFGTFSNAKGSALLSQLLELNKKAGSPFVFHFIGSVPKRLPNFFQLGKCHGEYERDGLSSIIKTISPSFALILSIWPETYCHTLTEAWAMGIPVIVSNIGTLKERVQKNGGGWLVSYDDAETCWSQIVNIATDIESYETILGNLATIPARTISDMAKDYATIYDRLLDSKTKNDASIASYDGENVSASTFESSRTEDKVRQELGITLEILKTKLWDYEIDGVRLGMRLVASALGEKHFSLFGWILGLKPNTSLRLSFDHQIYAIKSGINRADVSAYFPDWTEASKSGWLVADIPLPDGTAILQLKVDNEEWRDLISIYISNQDISGALEEVQIIKNSGLFDVKYYSAKNKLKDKVKAEDAIYHYLTLGLANRLQPNPLFDPAFYFRNYVQELDPDGNFLLDYLRHANDGKRDPCRWFDTDWYLKNHPDVKRKRLEPLRHFLRVGSDGSRSPSPDFDAQAYLETNPDVAQLKINPLVHYLETGSKEGRKCIQRVTACKWVYESAQVDAKKLNILLVGHVLGEKLFGSERSLFEVINQIDRQKYNIFCAFPQENDSFFNVIRSKVCGIVVFNYRWWGHYAKDSEPDIRRFIDILESKNISLIHVNTIIVREPLIAARRVGVQSIVHVRELISHDRNLANKIGKIPGEIISTIQRDADYIVANSDATFREFDKPSSMFRLYNSVDEAELNLAVDAYRSQLRVGLVSSNVLKKGFVDFIEIARMAINKLPNVKFVLIGPMSQDLTDYIANHDKIPSNVTLSGYVDTPRAAMEQIDIVLCLSHFAESFGRTVAEGMMSRRVPIVYNLGALPELIQQGQTGFIVDYQDKQAVLDKIAALVTNRSRLRLMAERARIYALRKFSRLAGRKKLAEIYDTILNVPSSGSEHSAGLLEKLEAKRKQTPLRLAYFAWHFPVPSETFVLNELRELIRSGIDVKVYCKQSPYKDFKPDFKIAWERIKSPEDLAQKLLESERDIVHAHFVYPTVTDMVWPACELAEIPFTCIAHAQDIFVHANAKRNRLAEFTRSKFCKAIYALGNFHRQFLIDQGVPQHKIIINGQGIPLDAFEPPVIADRLAKPTKTICLVHRFVEKKGIEYAILAMEKLAEFGISLHLYGYGPLEEHFRTLVTKHGLKNVFFGGKVEGRSHLLQVLSQHDIFLCPSVQTETGDMDGIPVSLMEAMAAHVPVVTTNIASIPDLVRHGITGFLCRQRDTQSLADTILEIYRMPKAELATILENARDWISKRYDVCARVKTLLRVWKDEGLDVIMVTYNNLLYTKEVIRRLYSCTFTPFRLIIVDNGSDQETKLYFQRLRRIHSNITILWQEKNLFVGPGTNRGLAEGRADNIVYLCAKEGYCLSEGWDQDILNYMEENPDIGLAGTFCFSPKYKTGKEYLSNLEKFPLFRNQEFAQKNPERPFVHVQGGMFVLRRKMYAQIGGFSESVYHDHTDIEYSYYVESMGWKLGAAPGVLSLFNKTRPDMTSRITEKTRIMHPGSPATSQLLTSISKNQTHFCNICAKAGTFIKKENEFVCPNCESRPYDRTLYRWLADSTLTYQRLKSLHIGCPPPLLGIWKMNFQGRCIEYTAVVAEIQSAGKIDQATDGSDLIVMRLPDSLSKMPDKFLSEIFRVLMPNGTLLVFQKHDTDIYLPELKSEQTAVSNVEKSSPTFTDIQEQLAGAKFTYVSTIHYASSVLRYSDYKMTEWRK